MSSTIITTTPGNRNYKSTSSLQTKRHTVSSVTLGHDGFSDTNEARYWTQKLGLGPSKYDASKSKYAHPRSVRIPSVRGAMTQQVLFGPTLTSKHPPLAVVSGPRVNLYGTSTTTGSSFIRAVVQSGKSSTRKTNIRTVDNKEDRSIFGHNEPINDNVDPDRQVQTGGHLALCAAFRNDGRLIAIGTDVGESRICDVTMRSTLTTFSANNFAVRSIEWFRNGQYIFSAGDDAVARVWDLSSTDKQKPLLTLKGHGDVIRCTALWQQKLADSSDKDNKLEWSQVAITGSYDHTVRVWNVLNIEDHLEEGRCLAVLMHGAPVEAVCMLKSENTDVPMWVLSAGGTKIKIWNPRSGQCIATIDTYHRKTITSILPVLRTNYEEDNLKSQKVSLRILSAGLDGVIQFHSWNSRTGSMRHLYSTKLNNSITSVAMDKSGTRFAFGTVSGEVIFRMRGPSIVAKKHTSDARAGTYSFFQRGMNAGPDIGDYTVTAAQTKKKRKLNTHEKAMKGFRYSEALDDVLASKNPKNIIGVLEELGKRRGLTHALSNRDEESLEPLLSFVIRNIRKPQFTSILTGIAHKLIDIYGVIAGQSELVDELFRKLKHQIALECKGQKVLMLLVGQIESFVAVSAEAGTIDK